MDRTEYGQLLRQIRHEYGNLLQVAGSYLDLGLITETKAYIQNEILKWHEEHEMLRNFPESFYLYLFAQRMKAREQGIELRYKDLQMSLVEDLMRYEEPCASIGALIPLPELSIEDPLVYVSLIEGVNGFGLYFESANFQPLTVWYGKE